MDWNSFREKKIDLSQKISTYLKDPLLRPNEHHDRRVPGIFTHTGGTYEFGAWLRNNKDGWFHHYWRFGNNSWSGEWMKFEMDAIESEPGTPETTRVIFTVDNKVYLDQTYNNHIYEHAKWVWIGDKSYPYRNTGFKMRKLFYGSRTEAKRWGLI